MDFHREIMNFNALTLVITYNDATHYSLVHIAWTDIILIYELYFNAYTFITWTYVHYLS